MGEEGSGGSGGSGGDERVRAAADNKLPTPFYKRHIKLSFCGCQSKLHAVQPYAPFNVWMVHYIEN